MNRFSKLLMCALVLFSFHFSFSQDLKTAIKLTESEQFVAAHKSFDALLNVEPDNGDNYFYYGECYIKQFLGDSMSVTLSDVTGPALVNFNKGIEKDPSNPLNYIGKARVNIMSGNQTEAADNIKKAIEE